MTLRPLDLPYADTSAAELTLALDGDAPALARLDTLQVDGAAGPGTCLALHLLGASHEAVLTTPAGELREVVACLPGPAPHLPELVTRRTAGVTYRFFSEVRREAPDMFRAEVQSLRTFLPVHEHILIGLYPGDPDAVTALHAMPGEGRVSWRTWHAYPRTSEIVFTRTTAELLG
ncbi:MAG: DUF2617 family protein [Micromonosporaceae bacterium]